MQEPDHRTAAAEPVPVADLRLVGEVLAKDRKATAEFVARCTDWVYPLVCYRLSPRAELVEDIMQEILLAAWRNLRNFRGDASLRSWVTAIARHKVEDYYRKRIRAMEIEEQDGDAAEPSVVPMLERQLDSAKQRQRLRETLTLLPEAYGIALLWRYHDGKSVREMAQLTGKTEKAMERLLARAREHFRRRWNNERA
jgi:RNA polymerase sigma-70 factor (ECF subfamily)